jgi:hypothetical protein
MLRFFLPSLCNESLRLNQIIKNIYSKLAMQDKQQTKYHKEKTCKESKTKPKPKM